MESDEDGRPYGIILAGGLARRMGGADKPLLQLADRPLLAHVLERMQPQCAGLVLSANGDPGRFAEFHLPIVADGPRLSEGPLSGLLAALDWIAAHDPGARQAVSVAADTPFLPGDFVARLQDGLARGNAVRVAQAASNGRIHFVSTLWPIDLRHDLRRALIEEGLRKVGVFAARHGCVAVDWPIEPIDPFFNVNTPEDLAKAEAWLRIAEVHPHRR